MRFLSTAFLALALAQPALAQVPGPTLSLDEATTIARQNNPLIRQTESARIRSAAQVRAARGSFLPSLDASFGTGFREGRPQSFGGVSFGSTSSTVGSTYSFNSSVQYNAATLMGPKAARANAEATEADIGAGEQNLRSQVTQDYIIVLQDQASVLLQDSLLANAKAQLDLARARAAAGAATNLDVQRAEVQLGQQQVAVLRAQNALETARLRLFEIMGVDQPAAVRLTTRFTVEQPRLSLEQVLGQARTANPSLLAARAREDASDVNIRRARSEYTPTLGLNANLGGYTNHVTNETFFFSSALSNARNQCASIESFKALAGQPSNPASCDAINTLTPTQQTSLDQQVSANRNFPFAFTRNPYSLNASLSIPIFNGFQREQRVQEAQANRNDAKYAVRAQELRLNADVTSAYLTLQTDFRAIGIQEQNSKTARDALSLAEERYRVGANSFLEVTQARADYVRAETDRINAIYDYHRAFAALESAVGRPLR